MKHIGKRISMLAAVLLVIVLSLAACSPAGGNYMTREDAEQWLKDNQGKIIGDVTVESAPTYNIEITADKSQNLVAAAKSVLSAVSITSSFKTSYSLSSVPKSFTTSGAGVIYKLDKTKGDAYIITNYHVVYDTRSNTANHISDDISLRLYGQDDEAYNIPATYVGGAMTLDLAVLKVEGSSVLIDSNAVAVSVADSDGVAILDTAIAVGNPASGGLSATVGCVNVDSEYIIMDAADGVTDIKLRLMRIDTAVNSGNSGGGLFNDRGELIGIVNAKMSSTDVDNIGYAIPSNIARYVADNIIHFCDGADKESPYKYMIGITMEASRLYTVVDTETGRVHKREEVSVTEISQGSIGEELFEVGDVIRAITIDGTRYQINRMYQVVDCMYNAREDSTITVEILRGTETVTKSLDSKDATLTKIA